MHKSNKRNELKHWRWPSIHLPLMYILINQTNMACHFLFRLSIIVLERTCVFIQFMVICMQKIINVEG